MSALDVQEILCMILEATGPSCITTTRLVCNAWNSVIVSLYGAPWDGELTLKQAIRDGQHVSIARMATEAASDMQGADFSKIHASKLFLRRLASYMVMVHYRPSLAAACLKYSPTSWRGGQLYALIRTHRTSPSARLLECVYIVASVMNWSEAVACDILEFVAIQVGDADLLAFMLRSSAAARAHVPRLCQIIMRSPRCFLPNLEAVSLTLIRYGTFDRSVRFVDYPPSSGYNWHDGVLLDYLRFMSALKLRLNS